MKYIDIRDKLKTGDIVLFSGDGPISMLIRLITRSRWSHVGMVVKVPDFDMVLLWESTMLNRFMDVKDVYAGTIVKGVQTTVLSDKISRFNGDVAIRQLNNELDDDKIKTLSELRNEWKNVPYEKDYLELLNSAIDIKIIPENEEDLSSIFCSELLAEALQRLNIIDDSVPSNEFVPSDFAEGKLIDSLIVGDYRYGPLIELENCFDFYNML